MTRRLERRRWGTAASVAALLLLVAEAAAAAASAPAVGIAVWACGFVVWQWLGFAWLVSAWASSRRPVAVAAAVALLLVVSAWCLGWIVRFRSGHFLDFEGLRLVAANSHSMWLHLVEAEPVSTLAGLGLAAALTGAAVALLWAQGAAWRGARPDTLRLGVFWTLLGIAIVAPPAIDLLEPASAGGRWHRTSLAALLTSGIDLLAAPGPDSSCLEPEDLVPTTAARRPRPPRSSIVLVAIESLRADVPFATVDGVEVMPNLSRLARSGTHLTRAYATSTHSDYADPAALASLYPLWSRRHHYYSPRDWWPRALPWDLVPHTWATAMISAQNEAWGGMDAFLGSESLDLLYDSRTAAAAGVATGVPTADEGFARSVETGELRVGKLDDRHVIDTAIDWLESLDGRPFVLAVNLQSSHFPYELGSEAPRPFGSTPPPPGVSFSGYAPRHLDRMLAAYRDALHYADAQLGRLVAALDPDRTTIAVYGDNGELFGEHGLFTHAKDPYDPALRVPVVIAGSGAGGGAIDYPASLIDLVPTVFGMAGGRGADPAQQGIDVSSSDRPPESQRVVFFHNEVVWSRVDGVILGGRWKYWQDRSIGEAFLFDLREDPAEERNLVRQRPRLTSELAELTRAWRCRQLAYYGGPLVYRAYFPPPPPGS